MYLVAFHLHVRDTCYIHLWQYQAALTSKKQVAPAFGIEGAESEANENHRGSHESCHDDAEEKQTRATKFHVETL